ncbi:Dbl homology domain-containing protein [Coprinopsis sp. MPI-PUGE-AT-0042]|nr:Dbl homology domain-containing protein [Coprinopsis sp. MPI-PUGE-AT-0042]
MSLYHACSSLRAQLFRIRGFQTYVETLKAENGGIQSSDPVTHLWDLFSLGISLCYIFDLLPGSFPKINNSQFNPHSYNANPEREKKRGIVLFAMQIGSKDVMERIPGLQPFTITDLLDRQSTHGLVKAVNSVSAIVALLLEDVFEPSRDSSSGSVPNISAIPGPPRALSDTHQTRRALIIRDMLETERRFVKRLELLHTYAAELVQQNITNRDSVHQLFPNLDNILDFQRRFLIRLETTLEQGWSEQSWGQHFVDCEEQLIAVYEPYCSHFAISTELLESKMDDFARLNAVINTRDLSTLLACPILHVCKYHHILQDLVEAATADQTYPYREVLERGLDASRRIFIEINEAMDRGDREQLLKSLQRRVTDWKGHDLKIFGRFLLAAPLHVTKSGIGRDYYVWLFEKIILCCKEAASEHPNHTRGVGSGVGQSVALRNTPLLLKGRIYLSNFTQAVPQQAAPPGARGFPSTFPLQLWWKGDEDLEYMTFHFGSQDQMQRWEREINRLIREAAARRSNSPHLPRVAPGPALN